MKRLSGIQSRAEERVCQLQQSTVSRSLSTTSRYVPLSYQQLLVAVAVAKEYKLTIPETQMPASQAMQPAQQSKVGPRIQQQPRGPQASELVFNEQQPGTSR